jgi:hypothetical protein
MLRKTLAALLVAAALPALAQDRPPYLNVLDDETLRGLADIARLLLPNVKLPDGSPMPPESEAERKTPLLPDADTRRIVEAGQLSAAAEWCKVEWLATVRDPLMAAERKNPAFTPRQAAYAGVLHDTAQGAWEAELTRSGECGPGERADMQNRVNRFRAR